MAQQRVEAHTPSVLNPHPTRYAELNGVLHDLVTGAQEALGDSFVGAYLQGSFALGAGDLHSDCDFLVVVRERPDAEQEAALRRLHADLPHRDGFWHGHLEGSYAVAGDLATVAGLGREWLYVDHGSDVMAWSEHCNQPWTRWILREHGITLVGPCPVQLMEPVPDDVLRDSARAGLATLTDDVLGWCPPTHRVVPALPRRAGQPQSLHDPHRRGGQQARRVAVGDGARRPRLATAAAAGARRPRPRSRPAGAAAPGLDGGRAGLRGVRRRRGLTGYPSGMDPEVDPSAVELSEIEFDHEELRVFWDLARFHAKLNAAPTYFGPTTLESVPPPAWAYGESAEESDAYVETVLADERGSTTAAGGRLRRRPPAARRAVHPLRRLRPYRARSSRSAT